MKKIIFLLVFIFASPLSQAQWIQIGDDIDGEMSGDWSGFSVSLNSDGSVVAIGAPLNNENGDIAGHVRVYQNQSGIWTQIGNDIDGEAMGDQSGVSVSLNSDGSVVAIGAIWNDGNGLRSGHTRIYENVNENWIQIGNDIDGEMSGDWSGHSVNLSSDGSIVAIGAIWNDGNGPGSGHVRVYQNQGGNWIQIGHDIDGEESGDKSGWSVSLSSDGSVVAIGAPENNSNVPLSGHVRIFQNQGGNWAQIGEDIDGETEGDAFGISVDLNSNGSILAIGSPDNGSNGITFSGEVKIYQNQNNNWLQIGNSINGPTAEEGLGFSVSLNYNGTIVAAGAPRNWEGHARVYQYQNVSWSQIGEDIDGEGPYDRSARSICLSSDGSILAIGASFNDGNGLDSGHVRVFNNPTLSVSTIVDANISVYPNPTDDILYIKGDTTVQKIKVFDILGRMIHKVKDSNKIDLSKCKNGTYFLRVYTDKGMSLRKVILK